MYSSIRWVSLSSFLSGFTALAAACASGDAWQSEKHGMPPEDDPNVGSVQQAIEIIRPCSPFCGPTLPEKVIDCRSQSDCGECCAPSDLNCTKAPCCNPYLNDCKVINQPECIPHPRPSRGRIDAETAGQASLVLDLTSDGAFYEVAADVNLTLVRLRTLENEAPLSEIAALLGLSRGKLLLGTWADMSQGEFAPGNSASRPAASATPMDWSNLAHNGDRSSCMGRESCTAMAEAEWCKPGTIECTMDRNRKFGCICERN
jgi:hypothetical protein